jgi:hypothetical protein
MAEDETRFKMLFDGCGVTNGLWGTIFAAGLSGQVGQVVAEIDQLLLRFEKVRVNVLGLSRGGMACLMLAYSLRKHSPSQVSANMILFDPVPGNSLTSATADVFGVLNFANQYNHVDSPVITRILGLYPHEPLPDHAFHAPLLPKYHKRLLQENKVTEEVILGCHQGAMWYSTGKLDQRLSFCRIYETLLEFGTTFIKGEAPFDLANRGVLKEDVIRALSDYCAEKRPGTKRMCHSPRGVYMVAHEEATHLNQWHYENDPNKKEGDEPTFLCEILKH